MADTKSTSLPTGDEPLLHGPFTMFDSSFQMSFLQPPSHLNASVLCKATYFHKSPLMKLGKDHPQAPPLHMHFSQSESFTILSGRIATTTTWDLVDTIHTPATTTQLGKPFVIEPYTPHRFWPIPPDHPGGHAFKDEDTVMLFWAHPRHPITTSPSVSSSSIVAGRNLMNLDYLFFINVISLVDDLYSKRVTMTPQRLGSLITMMHQSDAANIMWPGAWWLGKTLRWWVPWYFDAGVSRLTQWLCGVRKDGLMREYTDPEDWRRLNEEKKEL